MKTIIGKFVRSSDGKALANATLTLRLNRTAQRVIDTGIELEWPDDYEKSILLTEKGEIPRGVEIIANDEIAPEGTDYELRVFDTAAEDGPCPVTHYRNWLELTGSEPIDLNTLDPDLYPVPSPPPPPPPPPFTVPRTTKAAGFFGGIVRPPVQGVGPTSIFYNGFNDGPRIVDKGLFGVEAFHLAARTTINRVSIYIHTPSPVPGQKVIVGLYDLRSRKKLCQVGIDASEPGPASGVLSSPITLGIGDYAYAWATSHPCNTLRVYGGGSLNDPIASGLMSISDSSERTLSQGIVKGRVGALLPEMLGIVEERSGGMTLPELPVLAYFDKASLFEVPASDTDSQIAGRSVK